MKKFLLTVAMLLIALTANAEIILVETNYNMENFWQRNGKTAEKVLNVGRKIIHDNELKRVPIVLANQNIKNATSNLYYKTVTIYPGMLLYINNDDELAFVLGHEIAHSQEAYDGAIKLMAMKFNSKKYEYKADLKAIDYMVKSGYNPIAAIIVGDKVFEEPLWDWGFTYTHPKGSKRLMAMYEYIYKKYPTYLNTSMAKNTVFVDFMKQNQKEVSSFQQKQAKKKSKAMAL
jgi:predicted Zn-dependent protease